MVDPSYEAKDQLGNLVQLTEECAEVIEQATALVTTCSATQIAVSKLLRFGPEGTNPKLDPDRRITNADALARELDDLERRIGEVRKYLDAERATPSSDADTIRYYRASEKPYGAFSSLYRCDIIFEGQTFPTAEHAYQYGKPRKQVVQRWLMSAPTPALLAMAAHGLYYWDIAPGWSKHKVDRMRAVQATKFVQHVELWDLLLGTGDARLVESGTTDNEVNRFWGEVNGRGENTHGKILMEIRAELRTKRRHG